MSGVRNVARAAAEKMYARWSRSPLNDAVLLESFEGAGVLGDPAALARELLSSTDLPIIWALREPVAWPNPRMSSVRFRSAAYFKALATTRYLVNNVTFPPLFSKRADQRYLNTWHGTPLKKMGRDVDAAYSEIVNTVDNLRSADVLLSSSQYMTDTMYVGAYDVGSHHVVRLGTPRIDEQFPQTGGKDLVLYAPTWQEASYTQAADDVDALVARMDALQEAVDGQLILRVHSKVAARAASDSRLAGFLAPADESTNSLLARTRTLVTDFSSVAFDALASDVQVLFFTPENYPRGTYLSDDELPGPRTSSLPELRQWLAGSAPVAPVPPELSKQRFCGDEDGHASRRVVELLLAD